MKLHSCLIYVQSGSAGNLPNHDDEYDDSDDDVDDNDDDDVQKQRDSVHNFKLRRTDGEWC